MSARLSTQNRQCSALKRMLAGNSQVNPDDEQMIGEWKVLIYDRAGRDILLPLFSVAQLKNLGITLHLLLHSEREAIPDSSAIYFISPSDDNLKRVTRDLKDAMYESFEFNFISPIKREKLEDLAQAALSADSAHLVSKIYDQYSNFVSLEDQLFILRYQNRDSMCYYNLNRNNITDTEMNAAVDEIVDGLFSFLVTLGMIPFIRAQRNGIAEFVADRLDKKIRDNLRDTRNSLFQQECGAFAFNRPIILLLDRNFDLMTPMTHSWTYQSLIHDVLETGLNSVAMNAEGKKKQFYDLGENDEFWMKYRFAPALPDVAEAIHKATEDCQRQEDQIKSLQGGMDQDNIDLEDSTNKLTSAIENLPAILERKRRVDAHTSVATNLLDQIKLRGLDALFRAEDKILHGGKPERAVIDMLKDETIGNEDGTDKLRLLLVYLLAQENITEKIEDLVAPLDALGTNTDAVNYIRKLKSIGKNTGKQENGSGWGSKALNLASTFHQTISGKKNQVAATRALDIVLSSDADDYKYLDPKIMRPTEGQPRSKQPITQAIVFLIGGGSLIEYQNLVEFERQRNQDKPPAQKLNIIYGATEIPKPNEFLSYLTKLGTESQ